MTFIAAPTASIIQLHVVHPAASLPFHALEHGATVIEINSDPTPLTDKADYALTVRPVSSFLNC